MPFVMNRDEWKLQREQAQPVINKIFSNMERDSRWFEQVRFLNICKRKNLTPKGMRIRFQFDWIFSRYGKRIQKQSELKVLNKNISELYRKRAQVREKIAELKLVLREHFGFTEGFIRNTMRWLQKMVHRKMIQVKERLFTKLRNLVKEKERWNLEEAKRKMEGERLNKKNRCNKKIVYNNSCRELSTNEIELLSLGLNFGLSSKKFPLVEYIVASERLCLSLEEIKDDESIEKAQKIRNLVSDHIQKGLKMTMRDNLTRNERAILRSLKNDNSIIICPADKGKAVVIEDRDTYLMKMQEQIDAGDYEIAKASGKTLMSKIHKKN
jgi:hypothetical protein